MTVRMYKASHVSKYADVHPDEVSNWQNTGWQIVEDKPVKPVVEAKESNPLPEKPKKRGRKKKSA